MKKFIKLLVILVNVSLCGFSQTKHIDSWYMSMDGTIGPKTATLYLHKYGSRVEGYFYYQDEGKIIPFDGNIYRDNKLISSVYHRDKQLEEIFEGNLSTNAYTGQWSMNKKSLPFSFSKAHNSKANFNYMGIEAKKKIPNVNGEGEDEAEYIAASIWPASEKYQWLKKELVAHFNLRGAGEDMEAAIRQAAKEYFEVTASNNQRVSNEVFSEVMKVAFQSKSILSLAYSNFTISAGIDGHLGTSFMNFDLKNQKRLRIDDILDTLLDSEDIKVLLSKKAKSRYGLKPTQPLSVAGFTVEEIPLTDNFYLTAKGMGFNYTPGEISSSDMGEINLFIPYTELAYLNTFGELLKE